MNTVTPDTRTAILARMALMVKSTPDRTLGRTQVMKLFYFLQELKGVNLGYDFRLFTYGPFDSEVLSDLATACSMNLVVEKTVIYSRGYGYDISPGSRAETLSLDSSLSNTVEEVVREFGFFGAAELELRSTIYYVYREFADDGRNLSAEEITERVRQIKPYFDKPSIGKRVSEMAQKGYLQNLPVAA